MFYLYLFFYMLIYPYLFLTLSWPNPLLLPFSFSFSLSIPIFFSLPKITVYFKKKKIISENIDNFLFNPLDHVDTNVVTHCYFYGGDLTDSDHLQRNESTFDFSPLESDIKTRESTTQDLNHGERSNSLGSGDMKVRIHNHHVASHLEGTHD